MKWTGADIIAQLEDGWEIDEIARATRLGIAEVRRLEREERYKMRQRQSKQEAREMIEAPGEEVEEKEASKQDAEHPEWEWQRLGDLASLAGISPGKARQRINSARRWWLHWERAPVEEHPGIAHPRAKWVYRVRPGYPTGKIEPDQIRAIAFALRAEHGEDTPAVEPWEGKAHQETVEEPRSTDGADALEQIAVLAELYELTPGQILEWGPDGLARAIRDDRREARREGSAERQEEIEILRASLIEAREKIAAQTERLDRMLESLLGVHRALEPRGYGSDDKRAASEKIAEFMEYVEELENLERRREEEVEDLRAKIETLQAEALRDEDDLVREVTDGVCAEVRANKAEELVEEQREELGQLREELRVTRNERDELGVQVSYLNQQLESMSAQSEGILGEILAAADQGNPWPVLYRAKNEVRR